VRLPQAFSLWSTFRHPAPFSLKKKLWCSKQKVGLGDKEEGLCAHFLSFAGFCCFFQGKMSMSKRARPSDEADRLTIITTSLLEHVLTFLSMHEVARTSPTSTLFNRLVYRPTVLHWCEYYELQKRASLLKRTNCSKVRSMTFWLDFTEFGNARALDNVLREMPNLRHLDVHVSSVDNNPLANSLITDPLQNLHELELISVDKPETVYWILKNVLATPTTLLRLRLIIKEMPESDLWNLLGTFTSLRELDLYIKSPCYATGRLPDQPPRPIFRQVLDSIKLAGHAAAKFGDAWCHAEALNLEEAHVSDDFVVPSCVQSLELGRYSYPIRASSTFLSGCRLRKLVVHRGTQRRPEFLDEIARHADSLTELQVPFSWIWCLQDEHFFAKLRGILLNVSKWHLPHDSCMWQGVLFNEVREPEIFTQLRSMKLFPMLTQVSMTPCDRDCFLRKYKFPLVLPSGVEIICRE
jgi:hypothetical protein